MNEEMVLAVLVYSLASIMFVLALALVSELVPIVERLTAYRLVKNRCTRSLYETRESFSEYAVII